MRKILLISVLALLPLALMAQSEMLTLARKTNEHLMKKWPDPTEVTFVKRKRTYTTKDSCRCMKLTNGRNTSTIPTAGQSIINGLLAEETMRQTQTISAADRPILTDT